jgi:CPA1 family monovalent cation:H+ antiporter
MLDLSMPPMTVVLIVIVLSFIGAILSEKLKISYTTVLIAIGLGLSLVRQPSGLGALPLDRSIILGLIVPPLIFEAAMQTHYGTFKTVRKTVILLAILGVILSALLSGFVLSLALGLPLVVGLTFGVIVSPTDPVSVVNILKTMKAPERLTTILETESYFNDATAIILYPIAISLSFSPLESLSLLAFTFGGGVLIGLVVSGLAEVLHRLVNQPLAETYFTVAVMFGSYAFAESLGVSGLVAVAIAGLYMGNRTMRLAMSKETRDTLTKFWEVVTFMATSFAFLLLGLKADVSLLATFAPLIIVAFLAIFAGRVFSVYPIVALAKLLGERIPESWTKVLAMAGLRGAVSVTLALSLPATFPFRETIVTLIFGVALVSLIPQGELLRIYLGNKKLPRN